MIKRVFLICMLLVFISSGVSAQKLKASSVYLGGGIALPAPNSEVSEHYEVDIHGVSGLGFSVAPTVQILVKGEYHRFVFCEGRRDPLSIIMAGVAGKLMQPAPLMPMRAYCLFGFGFASASTVDLTDAPIKPYFEIGAGIETSLSAASSLFVQIRYVTIKTENEPIDMFPLTIGFKF